MGHTLTKTTATTLEVKFELNADGQSYTLVECEDTTRTHIIVHCRNRRLHRSLCRYEVIPAQNYAPQILHWTSCDFNTADYLLCTVSLTQYVMQKISRLTNTEPGISL